MTPAHRRQILAANERMAAQAMRVLAFAYKDAPAGMANAENELVFAGLAGMLDPPRKEVLEAVAKCRRAGIKTVMITGDHKITALAIAREIGLIKSNGLGATVLTGAELDAMSDDAFDDMLDRAAVFARVNPSHKLRIVKAFKRKGYIVAMTGDGVNDAPAVKEADIGVSMGITGTDVTKQAASIILLDDNFATLVAAVEEGRVVYGNIRKFIRYLLSCNVGEVVTMFAGMLMGLPVVLLPIQILLVNLATDGLPAMALGLEPAEPGVMTEKPRPANASVFSGGLLGTIAFRGCLIALTTLAVFTATYRAAANLEAARTAALVTLVMSQLFHVFECKSEKRSIFKINPLDNPALILAAATSLAVTVAAVYWPWAQQILSTAPLTAVEFLRAILYAVSVPVISALVMLIPKRRPKGQEVEVVEMPG
jgi:Ca2+-transporting ATPase